MKYFMAVVSALALAMAGCVRMPAKTAAPDALSPEEHYRLATIYESKGELDGALKEYDSAIKGGIKADRAYFGEGNVYFKMKKYKDAERCYLKAIELDPSGGVYYNNLGWLYMETGDIKKAEDRAREAAVRDPARAYVYLDTLGVIETAQDDYSEAEKSLDKAADLAPAGEKESLKQIYGHLLDLYLKTGDNSKASLVREKLKGL